MRKGFIEDLRCPKCVAALTTAANQLTCAKCSAEYPVINEIPRFVPLENYATSFGMQWNLFSETQLDSKNGTRLSEERFFSETEWSRDLDGQKILEAGCGMGRFSEIALSTGAEVYSLDYSSAVEAAQKNIGDHPNHCLVQASIYEIPFPKNFFDKIFCFGVLQHTPDVEKTFKSLVPFLKPGGELVIDVYAAPVSWIHPRQVFRPLTKRMNPERLHRVVRTLVPPLLKVSNAVDAIPKIGPVARHAVPVANYRGRYPLTPNQIKEWAILDTFDWLSPRYEQPQRAKTIRRWFKESGFKNIHIERRVGIYVARGHLPLY